MKKFFIALLLLLIVGVSVFVGYKLLDEDNDGKVIKKNKVYDTYKSGDVVDFLGNNWYVLYDSSKKDNFVTLISSSIHYSEEVPNVVEGIYETSDLNKFMEEELVKEYGKDNLVEMGGYLVRSFDSDDMRQLLDVKYHEDEDYYEITDCPDFICLNHAFYGTMVASDMNFEKVDVYNNISDIGDEEEYEVHIDYYNLSGEENKFYLKSVVDDVTLFYRPVINVYKDSLDAMDPLHYENFGE